LQAAASEARLALPKVQFGVHASLPLRFADVSTRRVVIKKQHPTYTTSNGDYGGRIPGQMDMPDVFA
jgi:hypothetical protein